VQQTEADCLLNLADDHRYSSNFEQHPSGKTPLARADFGSSSTATVCAGGLLPPRSIRATKRVITREGHSLHTRTDARGVSRARAASG
jgi:hypothetical protein